MVGLSPAAKRTLVLASIYQESDPASAQQQALAKPCSQGWRRAGVLLPVPAQDRPGRGGLAAVGPAER